MSHSTCPPLQSIVPHLDLCVASQADWTISGLIAADSTTRPSVSPYKSPSHRKVYSNGSYPHILDHLQSRHISKSIDPYSSWNRSVVTLAEVFARMLSLHACLPCFGGWNIRRDDVSGLGFHSMWRFSWLGREIGS